MATTTITMAPAPEGLTSTCPNCGESLPHASSHTPLDDALLQIEELQAQVRLLNQKAASAGELLPRTSILTTRVANTV